jgi:hypothetical protein
MARIIKISGMFHGPKNLTETPDYLNPGWEYTEKPIIFNADKISTIERMEVSGEHYLVIKRDHDEPEIITNLKLELLLKFVNG